MDRANEEVGNMGRRRVPCWPSPLIRWGCGRLRRCQGEELLSPFNGVEKACRRFENHLVEMVAEEGKMSDLADVEELLRCWKSLSSPVFVDLVCRFYGELCMDLFSGSDNQKPATSKS